MYLKRLEIYGFKTFAQRTTFEFLPGVTAVVGPNGSGKSNVADAVRWVLGEQSFSNLRSKRTDDLIFGGGKGRAPMGFAEVFLTIDNSDRLLPLAYDEVTIGRRAYRNGENEYTLNRARVRLRDILEAVAPLGSSYTLINQGLVDAALALQPEDRRRLFEDAAEIGPYQAKKQDAERRLRETEGNLMRLNDVVSELEPQLRTLRRQARDAEAVYSLQEELQALLKQQYAILWRQSKARLQTTSSKATELNARLSDVRLNRVTTLEALETARDQLRQQRAMLEQQHAALAELHRQYEKITRELAVASERVASFEQRQAMLEERRDQLTAAAATAQTELATLEVEIASIDATLQEARTRLVDVENRFGEKLQERSDAEAALMEKREAVVRATAALETNRAWYEQIERRCQLLIDEQASLQQSLSLATEEQEARRTAVVEAQQTLQDAERHIEEIRSHLQTLHAEIEQVRHERDQSDEQIAVARRKHGELEARYEALSRLVRTFEGTYEGVRAAMQWASREDRAGFALVSSLLRVPPELETAIEVALGARIQNIVIERWTDAEGAITYLKRSGSGRATFLPLDTLKISRRLIAPRLPGIQGVASDLIEVSSKYTHVAVYLLGRVLIAEDLAAARNALPKLEGGWTIVTLSGEQVATGGAVTGGAATRESGTLRRERELRELPSQISASRTMLDDLQNGWAKLSQQIDAKISERRQAEASLHQARAAQESAQRTLETRRRELHRSEDTLANVRTRHETIEREQATLVAQQEEVSAAILQLKRQQDVASVAVANAEAHLEAQLAATNEDETILRELRTTVTTLEAELRRHSADLRNRQQLKEQIAGDMASLEQQAQQSLEEQQSLNQLAERLRIQQAELGGQVEATTMRVADAKEQIQVSETHLEALEVEDRKQTGQMLALEAEHADAAIAVERARSERDLLWERAAEDNIDIEHVLVEDGGAEALDEAAVVTPELTQRVEQLRSRLRRMGPVNALAPEEYRAAQERHAFLSEQLADVRSAATSLRNAIGELDQVMQQHFTTTFDAVGREFSQTFTQLFGGGSAHLALLHTDGEMSSVKGIDIVAQPPGKRQLNLQLLSGGERALTAAALLFAILKVNPSPFCILDEVDAALDEANVVRFREALLALAEQTQFILITHNRGTVEAANTLYGITMNSDGGSTVLSLRLEEVEDEGVLVLRS
jgi:chromosome segregation protein